MTCAAMRLAWPRERYIKDILLRGPQHALLLPFSYLIPIARKHITSIVLFSLTVIFLTKQSTNTIPQQTYHPPWSLKSSKITSASVHTVKSQTIH